MNGQTLDGVNLTFTRRRYGKRTYTWVAAELTKDRWTPLGDPWPAINVSANDIRMAIARVRGASMCGYRETHGERWSCVRPVGHVGEHAPFDI